MSGALAVLRHVTFRGRTTVRIPADPPRDTRDPRAVVCADHHTACPCREAELNEAMTEAWSELHELQRLARIGRSIGQLHHLKRSLYGRRYCAECGPTTGWPCATVLLVAQFDWLTRSVIRDETGEVPF